MTNPVYAPATGRAVHGVNGRVWPQTRSRRRLDTPFAGETTSAQRDQPPDVPPLQDVVNVPAQRPDHGNEVASCRRMTISLRCAATLVAAVISFAPRLAFAQGDRAPADKTLSPYFFVQSDDPAVDRLPLKETRVDVAIAGVIADVRCPGLRERGQRRSRPATCFPRRPAPRCTACDEGRRTAYRREDQGAETGASRNSSRPSAKARARRCSKQSRPNVFTMNVANIMPGDRSRWRWTTPSCSCRPRRLRVRLPDRRRPALLVDSARVGRRQGRHVRRRLRTSTPANAESAYHLDRRQLSAGMPIQELASPSHPVVVSRNGHGSTPTSSLAGPGRWRRAIATSCCAIGCRASRSTSASCCTRARTRTSSC